MDFLNPRGNPFTSEDVIALLRGLSRIEIDPLNFEGEERQIAEGVHAIQQRVEESILLYERRKGSPLSDEKRALLKQTLTAKLFQYGNDAENSSTYSFLKRSQNSFKALLKLSKNRRPNSGGQGE